MPETSSSLEFSMFGVKLATKDIDRLTTFYENALGLCVANTVTVDSTEERLLQFPDSDTTMLILIQHGDEDATIGPGHGPVVFTTNDVAAAVELAESCGATVDLPATELGGICFAMLRDPDGHPLEFCWFPDGPIDLDGLSAGT